MYNIFNLKNISMCLFAFSYITGTSYECFYLYFLIPLKIRKRKYLTMLSKSPCAFKSQEYSPVLVWHFHIQKCHRTQQIVGHCHSHPKFSQRQPHESSLWDCLEKGKEKFRETQFAPDLLYISDCGY